MKTLKLLVCAWLLSSSQVYAKTNLTTEHSPLIGYFQNFLSSAATIRLIDVPREYTIINIAFASVNKNGTVEFNLQAPAYKRMTNGINRFKEDIRTLQSRGVKVLVSIGGGSANSFLNIDNEKKANEFLQSMERIIDDYGFNGVDYDLEGNLNNAESTYLLNVTQRLHDDYINKGNPLTFTIAPETVDVYWKASQGKYNRVIDSGLINFVSVQLYNSTCKRSSQPNSPCYEPGTQDFIVSQADSTIQSWKNRGVQNPETKYIIGLPATTRAASLGYVDADVLNKAISCLKTGQKCDRYVPSNIYPNLGGVMTWSINWDAGNNYSFVNNIIALNELNLI